MTITTTDPNRALWEARAHGEETPTWESLASEPDGIEQDTVDVPAGLWLRPPDAVTGPVILAIHGGGFVSGSVATHRRMFGHLARAAGVAMLAASLLLMSAWTDLEATGASYDSGSDPFFTRELVRGLAAGYLAGADPHDPLAAPLHADLRRLPPTYLQAGAEESLLDDSRQLAGRLAGAGVDVHLDEFADQVHTFQMGAGRTQAAGEAIGRGGSWLQSTLMS
jgi:monoterpene epsilon-lactone hydrolase